MLNDLRGLVALFAGGVPALMTAVLTGGCAEPNLGLAPFLCNRGTPECPDNYRCVELAAERVCVRRGTELSPLSTADSGVQRLSWDVAARSSDSVVPLEPDAARQVPDATSSPDAALLLPDIHPPPADSGPPLPDGGHFGCQTHAECKADKPCCCPVPFLPGTWACVNNCPATNCP